MLDQIDDRFLSSLYPAERMLFEQYASDTLMISSAPRYFELLWRNFDSYARTESYRMLAERGNDVGAISLFGWGKPIEWLSGTIGLAAGLRTQYRDCRNAANLLQLAPDLLRIHMQGPAVINEGTFYQAFGRRYDNSLDRLVKYHVICQWR